MTANAYKSSDLKGEPAAMLALAAGRSYREAAALAGVHLSTIARRAQDPDYRRRVQEQRATMISQAAGQLADATSKAVSSLTDLLEAGSEQTRLGAARAVLDQAVRYGEMVEIAERVARLEELLEADESKIRRIK